MAFDACMMRAVLTEFSLEFPEAKIEKVLQPRNDEIDMQIHYGKSSRRLVFNVGPNAPRLQLSDIPRENPLKAPMFCMLLRKYFTGARIVGVSQPGFDRIAVFTVSAYDEMGFKVERRIVCEIMGKYANLIILDADSKILAALKIIDFAASTVRQVLPGLKYQIPEKQDKLSPLEINEALFLERLSAFPPERTGEKFITSTYSGIATQVARELVYRAVGATDVPVSEISSERFLRAFTEWQRLLIEERYTPTVAFDSEGKPVDYSYMDITYLGDSVKIKHFDKLSELFDVYFAEKDRLEHIHQRARDLFNLVSNAEARTERKLDIQRACKAQGMDSRFVEKVSVAKKGCRGLAIFVRFVVRAKNGKDIFKMLARCVVESKRKEFSRVVDIRDVYVGKIPNIVGRRRLRLVGGGFFGQFTRGGNR